VSRFRRPANPVPLALRPELASWDDAGHPSQARLAAFLAHIDTVAAPAIATVEGRLAVELTVGLDDATPLDAGGRDLDNYLYPLAGRLGPQRLAAVFGRKVHGPSTLAIGPAEPDAFLAAPQFTIGLTGSYTRPAWKQTLHDHLRGAGHQPLPPGPVRLDITISTGPGRNWTALWKPLIDALGPILGETRPFHPRDDRIVVLGLHHTLHTDLGHDVALQIWWAAG
jgi:hypothetical protein